jgi:N-acetylmuramic acid 6-phosphate etherase
VVGLAASGSTPYVWGALRSAHARGADTALIACNPVEPDPAIRHLVELVVGPEAIAGSTRLRSGTVTKLALNTISTLVWARLGKTFRNRMVDVRATNHKLRERALRLVLDVTGVDEEAGRTALLGADGEVKRAIVMVRRNVSAVEASRMLSEVSGHLGQIDGVV